MVPELDHLRSENAEIKAILNLTNKRLDDINAILIDHSRRIDETNKRVDELRADLYGKIDETNKRIDELRADLTGRIDKVNTRIDRLYEVIVRRDEHEKLEFRVMKLEQECCRDKGKIAAMKRDRR